MTASVSRAAAHERVSAVSDLIEQGQWEVDPESGLMSLKTKRIGIFKVNAKAPIVGGLVDWTKSLAELRVDIDINQIKTGYSILDPQFKKLIASGSDGILVFDGSGAKTQAEVAYTGQAKAGDVVVDMTVTGSPQGDANSGSLGMGVSGTATFTDVSIPVPGFSQIKSIDILIEGMLQLRRK